jgi:tellurite resistance protein TerC
MRKEYKSAIRAIALGIIICTIVWITKGSYHGAEAFSIYGMEWSLSIDNLAVFAAIFAKAQLSDKDQHKVLNYGIYGAIVIRIIVLFCGVSMMQHLEWMTLVFAILLAKTAKGMWNEEETEEEVEKELFGFLKEKLPAIFYTIILVEATDVLFSLDSVPVTLSLTSDKVVAIAANLGALMGLRAMFFVINGALSALKYLGKTLSIVIGFVAVKMAAEYFDILHISPMANLAIVGSIFSVGIWASLKK